MSKRVRVNVRSLANTKAVRREKRNGREVVIVPSATLPDDVIMNDIQYPADEIEKSFASLNRAPAPLGHPVINGRFVSAYDPEAQNHNGIGAWNENVRRDGGRVFLDKVIDVERANQSEDGKRVLEAIDNGEPVHTSTGLLCDLEAVNGDVDYKHIARNIQFDHDAILLDEQGAATPEQGVGMMVNKARDDSGNEIEVINSAIKDAERELDWAGMHLLSAIERRERATAWERFKSAIMEALGGSDGREPSANKGDADMADEKQLNELSAKVNAIEESLGKIGETVTNAVTEAVKPVTDRMGAIDAANKAKDDAELTDLVTKITKANLLSEEGAKGLTLNAARELAKKAEPGKAAALNAGFGGTQKDDEWAGYSLNSHLDQKEAS